MRPVNSVLGRASLGLAGLLPPFSGSRRGFSDTLCVNCDLLNAYLHLCTTSTFISFHQSSSSSLIPVKIIRVSEIINAMEDKVDYSKIEFTPVVQLPDPFDVKKRIQELRSYLDPKGPDYQPENQHINIKAAIKLYEEGKIDGIQKVFIKDGKIVPEEETFKGPSPSFIEGIFHQFAEKHAYGHGPFGVEHHEVSIGFPIKKKKSSYLSSDSYADTAEPK